MLFHSSLLPTSWSSFLLVALAGCIYSSEPNDGNLTLSGKTYLLGDAQPTSGVHVTCAGVTSTSDAEGNYELRGIPEGKQILHAERSDCIPSSDTIVLKSSTKRFIYLSLRTTTIWGYVSNVIDGAIQGATVRIADQAVTSDASGRFEFLPIVGTSNTLYVEHPLYSSFETAVALDSARKQVNVTLVRQLTLTPYITEDAYVDESVPDANFGSSKSLLLSTNPPGQSGNQRHFYLKWEFPQLLRDQRVTLQLARLQLLAPAPPASSSVRIYSITSSWAAGSITYNKQPSRGALLESTDARIFVGSYWPVLTTSGISQLIEDFRANRPLFGVVIQGGAPDGATASFNSNEAVLNPPKLTIVLQY